MVFSFINKGTIVSMLQALDECTRNNNQQNEQYEDYTCTRKQAGTASDSTQFSHCDIPPFAVYSKLYECQRLVDWTLV